MKRRLLQLFLPCLAAIHLGSADPLAAQGASPAAVSAPEGAAAVAARYRLRAGDAVRLLVRDEPALAGDYPVLEDGMVLLPLVGLVQVGGTAFGDVAERVRAAYAAHLVNATVVVQPLIRIRVMGEVKLPGLYLVDATFGLRDVLAQAGGASPGAASGRVRLVRGSVEQAIDLGTAEPAAVVLQPGDEIVVPRRSWVRENLPVLVGAGTSVLAAALTALLVR